MRTRKRELELGRLWIQRHSIPESPFHPLVGESERDLDDRLGWAAIASTATGMAEETGVSYDEALDAIEKALTA